MVQICTLTWIKNLRTKIIFYQNLLKIGVRPLLDHIFIIGASKIIGDSLYYLIMK
jgi:hypothetical protein